MKKSPDIALRALLLRLLLSGLLGGILLAAPGLSPAGAASAMPEELKAQLESVAAENRNVQSIESRFRQTRYISFMDETLQSEGFFLYQAPDYLVWQYDSPAFFRLEYQNGRASFRNDFNAESGGKAEAPRNNAREEELAARIGRQIMLWIAMDLEAIQAVYDIELKQSAPLLLRFTPKKKSAGPISAIELLFAEGGPDLAEIVLHDTDGDYTRLEFHTSKRTVKTGQSERAR